MCKEKLAQWSLLGRGGQTEVRREGVGVDEAGFRGASSVLVLDLGVLVIWVCSLANKCV